MGVKLTPGKKVGAKLGKKIFIVLSGALLLLAKFGGQGLLAWGRTGYPQRAVFSSKPRVEASRSQSIAERITKEELPTDHKGWERWIRDDQIYLKSGSKMTGQEITVLEAEIEKLKDNPDHLDPLGFKVYGPIVTGRIHLINSAIVARKSTNGYPWEKLFGYTLYPENPENYPDLHRAVKTLQSLPLNAKAFDGYSLYLLPFSMGEASGYGGNGYSFLAAEPNGVQLIPEQLEVTLVHEFGHHLHFRYMDRDTDSGRSLWDEYLQLRGISWHGPGEVNTTSWSASSEETFAEDFRVWVGGTITGNGYFQDLVHKEPDSRRGKELTKFFLGLTEYRSTPAQDPWVIKGRAGAQWLYAWLLISIVGLGIGVLLYNRVENKFLSRAKRRLAKAKSLSG